MNINLKNKNYRNQRPEYLLKYSTFKKEKSETNKAEM